MIAEGYNPLMIVGGIVAGVTTARTVAALVLSGVWSALLAAVLAFARSQPPLGVMDMPYGLIVDGVLVALATSIFCAWLARERIRRALDGE
jgi:glycerol-3-phosphate acyltransferase PlsY